MITFGQKENIEVLDKEESNVSNWCRTVVTTLLYITHYNSFAHRPRVTKCCLIQSLVKADLSYRILAITTIEHWEKKYGRQVILRGQTSGNHRRHRRHCPTWRPGPGEGWRCHPPRRARGFAVDPEALRKSPRPSHPHQVQVPVGIPTMLRFFPILEHNLHF